MRIGELARMTGVSIRSLRYYEEQTMLASSRSHGGQRHYSEGAVDRVRLIQQLYASGLPSKTIARILPCVESGLVTPSLLDLLTTERDRIDQQAIELLSARDRLDDVISTARRPGPGCKLAPDADAESTENALAARV